MHHTEAPIHKLIFKHLTGSLTDDEAKMLQSWIKADHRRARLFNMITDPRELSLEYKLRTIVDTDSAQKEMEARISRAMSPKRHHRLITAAAAAVAALLITTLWLYTGHEPMATPPDTDIRLAATHVNSPIKPGTTKALLHNTSGQSILLGANDSTITIRQHIAQIPAKASNPPEQLCLEVPRGGEFKIILEDSTEVWLNSESTIRYPETFNPDERRVSITGEAYFHVKKDSSRPFYVETDKQVIRVYGTTFNIRAYSDENATFTTLESGSISLRKNTSLSGEVFIAMGHQAILDHQADELKMIVVAPKAVSSWRHGRFVFDDQPLERIMKDLSRWYDFEYEFADDTLRSRIFMGSIHRYADFRTAIQILENCGGIRFTINADNKILISPS